MGTELAPFAAGRASHRKARHLHKVAPRTGCFRGRPALSGRSFSGTEPAPFAAGRGPHRKARRLHKVASSTGCFRGRPALGAKLFSGAGLAPFAAGRGSHRKSVRRAQRSGMYGLDLWGWHHARARFVGAPPSGRSFLGTEPSPFAAGSRLPQKKRATCTTQRHVRARFVGGGATHGLLSWEARPRAEAFQAPSRRRSPRVAPPT